MKDAIEFINCSAVRQCWDADESDECWIKIPLLSVNCYFFSDAGNFVTFNKSILGFHAIYSYPSSVKTAFPEITLRECRFHGVCTTLAHWVVWEMTSTFFQTIPSYNEMGSTDRKPTWKWRIQQYLIRYVSQPSYCNSTEPRSAARSIARSPHHNRLGEITRGRLLCNLNLAKVLNTKLNKKNRSYGEHSAWFP